jgi:hypothetical protein
MSLALSKYFQENAVKKQGDPKELMQCDACGGKSFAECDACPYCGEEDDEASSSSEPTAASDKPSASASTPSGKPAPEPKPVVPPKAPGLAKTSAIVKDDTKASSQIQTARELDVAVKEVHELKGNAAAGYYRLGVKIREIFESNIWKLRVDEKNKPRWKGFDAFVHHELSLNPGQAYQLMDMTKAYSEPQVQAFGRAKIRLMLQAPEEDRPALEAKAKAGATKREIEAEVRKIKKEKGHRKPNRLTGKVSTGGGRKPAQEKVTVASVLGTVTVKLYNGDKLTPKQKKGEELEEAPRAKRFAEHPFGREVLDNGVVQTFKLRENAAGEWELRIERARKE